MQAVEFEADVKNGVITVPKELQRLHQGHLKIIALFQQSNEDRQACIADALRFPEKAAGFRLNWGTNKLTREQMNER